MTRSGLASLRRRAALFAGLADPVRLAILALVIAEPDITNMEVSAACEVSQTKATYHLARLAAVRLVVREKRSVFAHYTATRLAEQLMEIEDEP